MTASNFQPALDFEWAPDRDGNSDDTAPGENFLTRWGIIQSTWDNAVSEGIVKGTLDQATQAQCGAIYRVSYWNAMSASSLPSGVDLMAFNDATLSGVGHTVRLIQRIVSVTQDGAMGPITLRAANNMNAKTLIDFIVKADVEYLSALANAPKFIHGWTRRETACQTLAYKLARINSNTPQPALKQE